MPRTIICTVGTSLLTNARKAGADVTLDGLVRFLRSHLRRHAAETNVLDRMDLERADCVVLLHSATEEGALCASALARVAKDLCNHAESIPIASLGTDASKFKQGLRELNEQLIGQVTKARKAGNEPVFNANGGFKAMIAHAVALGAILKVPVYYMHEQFDELLEMPPLPLDWDLQLVSSAYFLLENLRDGLEYQDFRNQLQSFDGPDQERLGQMAEDLGEGGWMLGNVGLAMLEQFEALASEAPDAELWMTEIAAKKWEKIQGTSQRDRILKRLEHVANGVIRRAAKHSSDAHFYPAKGRVNERVMFWEDEPGKVVVYDFWIKHDDYERDVDTNLALRSRHENSPRVRFQP